MPSRKCVAPFIEDPDQWIAYTKAVARRYIDLSRDNRFQQDLFEDAVQEGLLMLISGGLTKADLSRSEKEVRQYLSTWIFNGIQQARRVASTPLSGCRRFFAGGNSEEMTEEMRVHVARAFAGRIHDSGTEGDGGAASVLIERGSELRCDSVTEPALANDDRALIESYLCILPPRDQTIMRRRFFDDAPMKVVAEEVGVSVQRIQQIQLECIRKIRAAIARRERMTGVAS